LSPESSAETRRLQLDLLTQAGRLLLEYDESTAEIHRALMSTARALADLDCKVAVSYSGVAVSLGGDGPALAPVRELRLNTALQSRVHSILRQVRRGELEAADAMSMLARVEVETPRHPRWLVILLISGAAACLAALLGADRGAALASALAAGLGLAARQELGRRRYSVLTLTFVAGLIGALIGGVAIRLGWTLTPGLALIVPSLIIVPGPHLINGLLDLFDNFVPMGIARLGLAISILIAAALGVIVGIELMLGELPRGEQGAEAELNVFSDMVLAAIVTCGFAAAYNTAWPHVGLAAIGGMTGHGLRFLALQAGLGLEAATLLGGFTVGVASAWMARSIRAPVAVIAFAGAVTMMPGLQIYRALGGAMQMARLQAAEDLPTIAATLGFALQATFVVGALAIGLVIGVRMASFLKDEND
jgi:uncharacterized membrane protein YjjP (DUF1212 family)